MTQNDAGVAEALENIREYFDDRADASMEPGDTQFHGNKEMALLQDVEIVEGELARIGKRLSDVTSAMHDSEQQRQAALRANRELVHGAADNLCEMQGRVEAAEQYAKHMREALEIIARNYDERGEMFSGIAACASFARAALAKNPRSGSVTSEGDASVGADIGRYPETITRLPEATREGVTLTDAPLTMKMREDE